jgi:hypothetical protein
MSSQLEAIYFNTVPCPFPRSLSLGRIRELRFRFIHWYPVESVRTVFLVLAECRSLRILEVVGDPSKVCFISMLPMLVHLEALYIPLRAISFGPNDIEIVSTACPSLKKLVLTLEDNIYSWSELVCCI